MISVVMGVYNESISELELSIDSILNQTIKDFEFIIVNDNPDNSVLKNFLNRKKMEDNRIRIIENESNIGLSRSLNKGIDSSKFDIIARMDADDISHDTRFQFELNTMIEEDADVVFTKCCFVNENGLKIGESRKFPKKERLIKALEYKNIIPHPTVMLKKKAVMELGGYSEIPVVEDYDLWLRMIRSGKVFVPINKVLLDYRVRSNSMTNSNYFKTYVADRLIKKHYKKQYSSKLTAEIFIEYYNKMEYIYNVEKFNTKYRKYVEYMNSKNFLDKFKLIWLIIFFPNIYAVIWNTLNASRNRL